MNMNALVTVTEEMEQEIREESTHWLVPDKRYNSDGKLHIDTGGKTLTTLCEARRNIDTEFQRKGVNVFPPGYQEVCQFCATVWCE